MQIVTAIGTKPGQFSSKEAIPLARERPSFTPKQIGQRAEHVASGRITCNPGTTDRLHRYETLAALLQHIRNLPSDTHANLRIKGNDLVAKLPSGKHRTLIAGFRQAPDRYGAVDALSAMRITGGSIRGSRGERFRCAFSWLGNRLLGRDLSHDRDERLPLDRATLEKRMDTRLNSLMTFDPCCNGILPHGEPEFFRGKNAAFLEGRHLAGMPLHECDLRYADLRGKDLSGCSLPIDLTGADLRGAILSGVTFGKPSPFHKHLTRDRYMSGLMDKPAAKTYEAFAKLEGKIDPDFTGVILDGAKLSPEIIAAWPRSTPSTNPIPETRSNFAIMTPD